MTPEQIALLEKAAKSLSRYLFKGQDIRLISDYDPAVELTAEHSQVVIDRAEEFLNETNRYLASKGNE